MNTTLLRSFQVVCDSPSLDAVILDKLARIALDGPAVQEAGARVGRPVELPQDKVFPSPGSYEVILYI